MDELLTGRLLVAAPVHRDGVFDRSVVFVLHHDDEGALGIVLNRPSEVDLLAVLPRWYATASSPSVLFSGGPVSPGQVLGLARFQTDPETGSTAVGTVDLETDPEPGRVDAVRVFSGYAGWSAGQLETEIASGGWYVVAADVDDPFTADPVDLWRRVLRRQTGQLALVASYPDDPAMN
ncbi:MAG TPA: YqgE/AlgH family protein [Mycobacteriales bacterium]|nr:YqgE/AlgH family protein [Mycobacteriales bacterium]